MRVCAGIITWQDGAALENAIESVRGVVDAVVIADGLIDGIDPGQLEPFSPHADLAPWYEQGATIMQRTWATQSAQRDWTLQTARQLECDWLLAIDADEQLCNAAALRPWLDVWKYDAFPLPFYFTDTQQAQPAAFKCLHVPSWRRFVCQGSILENQQGELVQVMGQGTWTDPKRAGMPYLIHRPELRPEARQTIRLSEHEVALEPYPDDVKAWLEPVHAPALPTPDNLIGSMEEAAGSGLPVWYCPGCGRRYAGPGSCSVQHERIGLAPVHVAGAVPV